jgi:O-6-methylguanine DNA methyltransferase
MSIENELERLTGGLPHGLSEDVALGIGLADGYDFYDSAIGQVVVTFSPSGVSSLDIAEGFLDRYAGRHERLLIRAEAPSAWRHHIPDAIEMGSPGRLPVDFRAVTEFQQEVLRTTATIPKGEVRPYGWVAKEVRRPKAVRAVGSAVARNPIPLIIPCHRVVRTDGHLGNYSLGGPHNKVGLLEHEGARPATLEELASQHVRVRADSSTGVYCHPTCHIVRSSIPTDVVDFRSSNDAEDAGFLACVQCRPVG